MCASTLASFLNKGRLTVLFIKASVLGEGLANESLGGIEEQSLLLNSSANSSLPLSMRWPAPASTGVSLPPRLHPFLASGPTRITFIWG